jgi:hypothetical protein
LGWGRLVNNLQASQPHETKALWLRGDQLTKETELRLSFWRDGSTQAERLAAAALRLSGYEEIDPQSPLGGPDGSKDILCRKGGLSWVAAVYFPTAPVRFTAIKKKFWSDLSGAPQGVYFCNEPNTHANTAENLD